MIALHGGSWKGDAPSQLAERTLSELTAPARAAGLRLLVPLAPAARDDSSGNPGDHYQVPWLTAEGESLVLSLCAAEVSARRADAARLYLVGHGAGATGALTLAARHPRRFAAVAAWSGTPEPLWNERQQVVGLAEDVVGGLAGTALYLWTGTDDRTLDAATLELFTSGLRAARAGPEAAAFTWERAAGGHGFGPGGPARGLQFIARQRHASPSRERERPG